MHDVVRKVELVNAFRIKSSHKRSKIYSNRVLNIISECSEWFYTKNPNHINEIYMGSEITPLSECFFGINYAQIYTYAYACEEL
jgi:hypothetical protein